MAKKRKNISKTTRFEVFKRDEFTCQYCGSTPPKIILEVDHVIPVKEGGGNQIDNLTTSCYDCNRGKGARSLKKLPEKAGKDFEKRKEQHEQMVEFNLFLLEKKQYEDDLIEDIGVYWMNNFNLEKNKYTFGPPRVASIRRFMKDLAIDEIYESIEIAFQRGYGDTNSWRYFCGVCWNKIKGVER